jgi:hypothetical protein
MEENQIIGDPLQDLYNEFNSKLKLAKDYNEFKSVMQDPSNRKAFFDEFNPKLKLAKDYDEFDSVLGLKKKELSLPSGEVSSLSELPSEFIAPLKKGISPNQAKEEKLNQLPIIDDGTHKTGPSQVVGGMTIPTNLPKQEQLKYENKLKVDDAAVNTLIDIYNKKGLKFDPSKPAAQKQIQEYIDKEKNNDLVRVTGKDGKEYLTRGQGFGEATLRTFGRSLKDPFESSQINFTNNPSELADLLDEKAAEEPNVPESAPSKFGGYLGGLVGGLPKMAALLAIPYAGESAMVIEMYHNAMANQRKELYQRGLDQGMSREQAAKKAMETAPTTAIPDAVLGYAMAKGVGTRGAKNILPETAKKSFIDAAGKLTKEVGAMSGMGFAGETGRGILTKQAGYDITKDEILQRGLSGASEWGLMHAAFKLMHVAPKAIVSAAKNLLSHVPEPILKAESENYPDGEQTLAEVGKFANTKTKVADFVPENKVAAVTGLTEKTDNLKKDIEALEQNKKVVPPSVAVEIDNQIKDKNKEVEFYDKQIKKVIDSKSETGIDEEVDDITGKKIGTKTYIVDGKEVSQSEFEAMQGKPSGTKTVVEPIEIGGLKVIKRAQDAPNGEAVYEVEGERFLTADGKELKVAKVELPKENAQSKIENIAKDLSKDEFLNNTHVVPLEGLDPEFSDATKAKVLSRKSRNPEAPIRLGFRDGKVTILDGAHRYYEAVERGDKTIKANFAYGEGADKFYDKLKEVKISEVDETANALKSFDKIIKGTKTAGTEVYHKAVDLINKKNNYKFTGKGWEDVSEAYHKALKSGDNPELVELIDKTLGKEVKPTEVKEKVKPEEAIYEKNKKPSKDLKNITSENIKDKLKHIEFEVATEDGVKDIHHGSDVKKTGIKTERNDVLYDIYTIEGRDESSLFEFIINDKGEVEPLYKKDISNFEIKQLPENEVEIKNTAEKLKNIADLLEKDYRGGKISPESYEVYNEAEKLIGKNKFNYRENKWEDISDFYHKALKDGKNPELVKLIDGFLKIKEKPIEVEAVSKDDLKKAEAKFATAEDKFKKARNKIEATQVKQAGMFGGEQKGMFAMGGEEAKGTLDPLRKATKEAKAELDDIRNKIKVQEQAQPELTPVESKKDEDFVDKKIKLIKEQGKPLSEFKVGDKVFFASDWNDKWKQYGEGVITKAGNEYEIKRFSDNPMFKRFKEFRLNSGDKVMLKPNGEANYIGEENIAKIKKEVPKKTYQEVLKEKQEEEKKRNREIGAEKATKTKEVFRKLSQTDRQLGTGEVGAQEIALRYLADGGKVSEDAINEAYGTRKTAELNTGRKEVRTTEARARDYAEGKETLDGLAHRLWEANDQRVPEDLIKDALMAEIGGSNTRLDAAEAYLDNYNEEYKAEKYYARIEEDYQAEHLAAQEQLEKELRGELDKQIEGLSSEEHINNLIDQYETETKGENQQPRAEGEGEANKEIGGGNGGEKVKVEEKGIEDVPKNEKRKKINAKFEELLNQENLYKKFKIKSKCL